MTIDWRQRRTDLAEPAGVLKLAHRPEFLTHEEVLAYLDEGLPLGRVTDNRQAFEPVKPFRTPWRDLVGWPRD